MSRPGVLAWAGVLSAAAACADATGPVSGADCSVLPDTAVVQIQDANLELAVRAAVGLSTLLPLTCGVVGGLTTLNASSRGVVSVEGLEHLSALTTLNIRDNEISDIRPLSSLRGLTVLNLAANEISDVEPLRSLTALTFLAINDNGAIADIGALSTLTSLSGTLWLGGNDIQSVEPLRGLTGLTAVRAWDNRITSLSPLEELTGLTEINFYGNALTSTGGLASLPALRSLNLHDNPHLADIQHLIDNPAIGAGADVNLRGTAVSCTDVETLSAKGAAVISDCSRNPE